MCVPLVSDPEVWERLYERFPYLAGQPLTLHGAGGDDSVIGTLEAGEWLAFVSADDQPLPYPPDFPFLTQDENRALARYVQVLHQRQTHAAPVHFCLTILKKKLMQLRRNDFLHKRGYTHFEPKLFIRI